MVVQLSVLLLVHRVDVSTRCQPTLAALAVLGNIQRLGSMSLNALTMLAPDKTGPEVRPMILLRVRLKLRPKLPSHPLLTEFPQRWELHQPKVSFPEFTKNRYLHPLGPLENSGLKQKICCKPGPGADAPSLRRALVQQQRS